MGRTVSSANFCYLQSMFLQFLLVFPLRRLRRESGILSRKRASLLDIPQLIIDYGVECLVLVADD